MKRRTISALVLAVVASGSVCCLSEVAFAGPENEDRAALVAGNTEFALDLYAQLRAEHGNLILSPYSISTALAMTYAGARTETARQMSDVLHYSLGQERLHPAFAALESSVHEASEGPGCTIHVAKRVVGATGLRLPRRIPRSQSAAPRSAVLQGRFRPRRGTGPEGRLMGGCPSRLTRSSRSCC